MSKLERQQIESLLDFVRGAAQSGKKSLEIKVSTTVLREMLEEFLMLRVAVERVAEVHQPMTAFGEPEKVCSECFDAEGAYVPWPCLTFKQLGWLRKENVVGSDEALRDLLQNWRAGG